MKKAIFFSLFIFISIFSYCGDHWFIGNWEGKGIQVDGLSWAIKLSVADINKATVEYSDLKCSGVWNYTGAKGKKMFYTEHIEEGTENCDQGCELTVTQQSENEIQVIFVLRSFHKSKPIAKATLNRIHS